MIMSDDPDKEDVSNFNQATEQAKEQEADQNDAQGTEKEGEQGPGESEVKEVEQGEEQAEEQVEQGEQQAEEQVEQGEEQAGEQGEEEKTDEQGTDPTEIETEGNTDQQIEEIEKLTQVDPPMEESTEESKVTEATIAEIDDALKTESPSSETSSETVRKLKAEGPVGSDDTSNTETDNFEKRIPDIVEEPEEGKGEEENKEVSEENQKDEHGEQGQEEQEGKEGQEAQEPQEGEEGQEAQEAQGDEEGEEDEETSLQVIESSSDPKHTSDYKKDSSDVHFSDSSSKTDKFIQESLHEGRDDVESTLHEAQETMMSSDAGRLSMETNADTDFLSFGATGMIETQPTIAEVPEQSPPPPPPPPDAVNDEEEDSVELPPTALHPVWSFGLNRHVPVINLSNNMRSWIFYACAHLGIIYDIRDNKQTVLQGHSNAITCTAASADKRWLVTGDKGDDSLIVIWDSSTGMPVRSMFEPHPSGVVAVALTPDARYLATLSAEATQTFAIWDWTTGDELPLCSATLCPEYGVQHYIMFNPEDVSHVVTNSDCQVLFYCWKGGRLQYFAPPLTDKDFNKPVGKYSNSVFLNESTRALTATSQGLIVVWDSNTPLTKVSQEATPDKKAVKLVPMHDRGINVLTTTGDLIVTGDNAGVVKFFDQSLQLTYWYQNFTFGPINSLSFGYIPRLIPEEEAGTTQFPRDCTIPSRHFIVRDFVLGTSTAVFATVDVDGTRVQIVHRDHDATVNALAAHPFEPRIVVGGYSGLLKIWNYRKKIPEVSRYFDRGNQIRCCSFDPKGEYLALGFVNGVVRILDAISLNDITAEPFHYARDEVTHLAFSSDSKYLATADGEYTTTLFRQGRSESEDKWMYVGRHRAHYRPIRDIAFGLQLDSGTPRLLTVGEDRFLVEYDIARSSKDYLPILQKDRIEQSATPLCMTWYPSVTKEQFLCTSNDQFKLKLYNTTTKMCRKTLLGPTFGSPIKKMVVLSQPNAGHYNRRYLSYIINDKVGLIILPLDGNPHNAMCLVAHPGGVTNLACSYDGRFIFTAGGTDTTVHMWAVHTQVLDAQSLLGGEDLTPFYGLLEGGRDGRLFAELEDYFYYAQLRSQGINTMDTRNVSTHIPISEVPFVMRALGFYPTEQEIEDMMNEIKFSRYVDTGEYVTEIDLGAFIRLFVNHRPSFGLDMDRIAWAFDKLGLRTDDGPATVDRTDLLDILQTRGEHMSEYELAEYITTLLGYNPEGGSCELEDFDPSTAGDIIEANLPVSITADVFTRDILSLGIPPPEAPASAKKPSAIEKQSSEVQTSD